METIYYHLNTRRVKVVGGPDLMTLSHPHAEPVPAGGGQLLDFERGRLRLERKALLADALVSDEPEVFPDDEVSLQPQPEPAPRTHKVFLGLDLLASVAVLALCGVMIRVFTAVL